MRKVVYITDCEGPLTKDDNALDVASHFIEGGEKLFVLLSSFDDYLGYVERPQGYTLGSTLLYILPFLKAEGVKDRDLREFSGRNVTIVPGARGLVEAISGSMDLFIVSTSYLYYAEAVSRVFGIPMDRIFSTELSLDSYEMGDWERETIREQKEAFLELPMLEWGKEEKGTHTERAIRILKEFFFQRIKNMPIYAWLSRIKIMGGVAKRDAIREICRRTGVGVADTIYVGDSITDVEALRYVRDGGGLSLSFNGNRYAVSSSEYVVIAEDAGVMVEIARRFSERGKQAIEEGRLEGGLIIRRKEDNLEEISSMSERKRKEVRGERVGRLG